MKFAIGNIGLSDIRPSGYGRSFLERLRASHPTIRPTHIGHFEPLKPVEEATLEERWSEPFLWSNGTKCEGMLWTRLDSLKFTLSVNIALPERETESLWAIAEEVFSLTPPGFCWVHPIESVEWDLDPDFAQMAYLGFPDPRTDFAAMRSRVLFYRERSGGSVVNPAVLARYAGKLKQPNKASEPL